MKRAFSPHDFIFPDTQPVGLGWYEDGPLALQTGFICHRFCHRFITANCTSSENHAAAPVSLSRGKSSVELLIHCFSRPRVNTLDPARDLLVDDAVFSNGKPAIT